MGSLEILGKIKLEVILFWILMTPATFSYVFCRIIFKKSLFENMNLILLINLLAFNFIIKGFVEIWLYFLELFAELSFFIFSRENAIILFKVIQLFILLIICKKFIPEDPKENFVKKAESCYNKFCILMITFSTLTLLDDVNLVRNLFNNEKFLISITKVAVNPFALILNTAIGVVMLVFVEKKLIPSFINHS